MAVACRSWWCLSWILWLVYDCVSDRVSGWSGKLDVARSGRFFPIDRLLVFISRWYFVLHLRCLFAEHDSFIFSSNVRVYWKQIFDGCLGVVTFKAKRWLFQNVIYDVLNGEIACPSVQAVFRSWVRISPALFPSSSYCKSIHHARGNCLIHPGVVNACGSHYSRATQLHTSTISEPTVESATHRLIKMTLSWPHIVWLLPVIKANLGTLKETGFAHRVLRLLPTYVLWRHHKTTDLGSGAEHSETSSACWRTHKRLLKDWFAYIHWWLRWVHSYLSPVLTSLVFTDKIY